MAGLDGRQKLLIIGRMLMCGGKCGVFSRRLSDTRERTAACRLVVLGGVEFCFVRLVHSIQCEIVVVFRHLLKGSDSLLQQLPTCLLTLTLNPSPNPYVAFISTAWRDAWVRERGPFNFLFFSQRTPRSFAAATVRHSAYRLVFGSFSGAFCVYPVLHLAGITSLSCPPAPNDGNHGTKPTCTQGAVMSLRVVGEGFAAPMFTQVKHRRWLLMLGVWS